MINHSNENCYCEQFQLPHVPYGIVFCGPCMDDGCSCLDLDYDTLEYNKNLRKD